MRVYGRNLLDLQHNQEHYVPLLTKASNKIILENIPLFEERARNVIWTYRDGVDGCERLEGLQTGMPNRVCRLACQIHLIQGKRDELGLAYINGNNSHTNYPRTSIEFDYLATNVYVSGATYIYGHST